MSGRIPMTMNSLVPITKLRKMSVTTAGVNSLSSMTRGTRGPYFDFGRCGQC